jgi:hypothetical protein
VANSGAPWETNRVGKGAAIMAISSEWVKGALYWTSPPR